VDTAPNPLIRKLHITKKFGTGGRNFATKISLVSIRVTVPTFSVADSDLGTGAFLARDPAGEKIRVQIRDEHPISFFRELRKLFWLKILKLFDADAYRGSRICQVRYPIMSENILGESGYYPVTLVST
jgi:hypothetical protein